MPEVGTQERRHANSRNESTPMTTRIEIYDTTLRDGTQGEGVSFSRLDKIKILRRLDDFRIDFVEGGWPSLAAQAGLEA